MLKQVQHDIFMLKSKITFQPLNHSPIQPKTRGNQKRIMNNQIKRKCIGCFETKNRDEMIKITREHETNEIFINPNSKIFGRSVYLCYNNCCIENSLRKNKLAKFLKADLTSEFKEKLRTLHKETDLC